MVRAGGEEGDTAVKIDTDAPPAAVCGTFPDGESREDVAGF